MSGTVVETSKRLGQLEYEESQAFRMVGGLIGLPMVCRCVLVESPEIEPLKWLVSVEGPETSLLVIDPRLLDKDFAISLPDEDLRRLEIDNDEDPILPLALVVLGEVPEKSTANLRAPIFINTAKMLALQVVPTESSYTVHHPLLPKDER